jgi:hypothetical protein
LAPLPTPSDTFWNDRACAESLLAQIRPPRRDPRRADDLFRAGTARS